MNFAWLIPSMLMGSVLAASSGNWFFLLASVFGSLLAALLNVQFQAYSRALGDLSFSGKHFYLGDQKLSRLAFFWPPEIKQKVLAFLLALENSPKRLELTSKLVESNFLLTERGLGYIGFVAAEPVGINLLSGYPHLAIIGPTGSGKSFLLERYFKSLYAQPQQFQFVLIDFKMAATFAIYSDKPRISGPFSENNLAALQQELERLELLMHQRGLELGFQHTPVFVLVDEFAHLLSKYPKAAGYFENFLARGRSVNIHVVVATQNLSSIPRSMQAHLRSRIAVGHLEKVELLALGDQAATPVVNTKDSRSARLIGLGQAAQHFDF